MAPAGKATNDFVARRGDKTATMPFKSQAQRRKFAELLVQGKISPQTFEEWNRETGGRELPERVKKAKKTRKTAKAKRTSRQRTRARRATRRRSR